MAKQRIITGEEFRRLNKSNKWLGNQSDRSSRGEESKMQEACVRWYRLAYPAYRSLLISIPNSAGGSQTHGATLKKEGLMPGAADLMLLVPRKGFAGLAIEMKTPSGRLSPHQLDWGIALTEAGYLYQVCRSFDKFRETVDLYFST